MTLCFSGLGCQHLRLICPTLTLHRPAGGEARGFSSQVAIVDYPLLTVLSDLSSSARPPILSAPR